MRYAIINPNDLHVIEIVESNIKPHVPPLPDGTEVKIIECGSDVQRGFFYVDNDFTSKNPNKVEIEEPVSEQDELNAEMLLNQSIIIAKQEEQDAVLAEILLNQMEG